VFRFWGTSFVEEPTRVQRLLHICAGVGEKPQLPPWLLILFQGMLLCHEPQTF